MICKPGCPIRWGWGGVQGVWFVPAFLTKSFGMDALDAIIVRQAKEDDLHAMCDLIRSNQRNHPHWRNDSA